jgi:hypothetical protein
MFKIGDLSGEGAKGLVRFFVEATNSSAHFYALPDTIVSLFEDGDALLAHMESPLQNVLVHVPNQKSADISIVWNKGDFECSNVIDVHGATKSKTGEFIPREDGNLFFQSEPTDFEGDLETGRARREQLSNLVHLIQLSLD